METNFKIWFGPSKMPKIKEADEGILRRIYRYVSVKGKRKLSRRKV